MRETLVPDYELNVQSFEVGDTTSRVCSELRRLVEESLIGAFDFAASTMLLQIDATIRGENMKVSNITLDSDPMNGVIARIILEYTDPETGEKRRIEFAYIGVAECRDESLAVEGDE